MRISPIAALLAASLATSMARAADVDVLAGVSVTTHHETTDAEFVDVGGDTREWRGIHYEPVFSIGRIGSRDVPRLDLDRTVYIGAVGLRLVDWWGGAFFAFQLGYAAPETIAVSSHAEFVTSLGWRSERWEVMFRHISNGDALGGPNRGESMLLAGLRF